MPTSRLLLFSALAILLITQCQTKEVTFPSLTKQRSWSEVLSIAERYGFDSLSLPMQDNSAYMYMPLERVEQKLRVRQKARASQQEYLILEQKSVDIRTFEDYENLINSLPHVKASYMEAYGGPVEYEKYMSESRPVKWHIYRSEKGVLRFMRPENDRGYYEGEERIDNKPRAK